MRTGTSNPLPRVFIRRSPARAERRALPFSSVGGSQRWRAIIWAIDPGPVFGAFAQAAPHRVHEDVIGLLLFLVMVAQAVVEEVSLPVNLLMRGEKMFPVPDGLLHPWLARECDDAVEMIGHEYQQPAMPGELAVVVRDGGKNGIANPSAAQLIRTARGAVDGDKEE